MSRALLVLANDRIRQRAVHWIMVAPKDTRVEFKGPRRSNDQNSLLWVWLTEIATKLEWHGQKYSADDWKDYLMHSLRRARWMPDEDGGMVPIGMRTSDLSKEDFSNLLELTMAFATSHGVNVVELEPIP
jgi:NinB protein